MTYLVSLQMLLKQLTTGKYLNVMRECGHNIQHDLMGKLSSIKHYLLLDQGDFLVHFMDIAREELMKKPDDISTEKLQSLLDLAMRSTAAVADSYHEDLTFCVETTTLLKRLSVLRDLQINQIDSSHSDLEEPVRTDLETFALSFTVCWPLSLVISRKALTKYQLIFRLLFHCKHVNRQLCGTWQLHQVLEPNWHVMHNKVQTARSIDEKLEKMKVMCLQYAAAAPRLITYSVDTPKTDALDVEKYKKLKLRTQSQEQKVVSDNPTVIESILKFEKEFSAELQSLGPILSSSSSTEPYLTHLAQWLLGVGRD